MARRSPAMVRYKRIAANRRLQLADGLIRAALLLLQKHQANLNRSNPYPYLTPSRPGEYPRKRTGFGSAGYSLSSTNRAEIAALLTPRVSVGVSDAAKYMETFLIDMGRKGINDTKEEVRAEMRRIIEGAVK